jgi:transcription-repair coupling factor (superfamily II helicase)
MSVRLLLKKAGITRLDVTNDGLIFTFSPDTDIEPERLVQVVENRPKKFHFLSERKLKVTIGKQSPLETLHEAKGIIPEFANVQHGVTTQVHGSKVHGSRLESDGD